MISFRLMMLRRSSIFFICCFLLNELSKIVYIELDKLLSLTSCAAPFLSIISHSFLVCSCSYTIIDHGLLCNQSWTYWWFCIIWSRKSCFISNLGGSGEISYLHIDSLLCFIREVARWVGPGGVIDQNGRSLSANTFCQYITV